MTRSAGRRRGAMALTIKNLRTTLAAALAWSEPEVGAYLAALQARGALSAGDAVLGAGDIVVVLLAFVSGSPPAEAVNETLRLISFEHRGFCQRSDRAGRSAIEWTEAPPAMQMPAPALGAVLSELILAMRAGA